jgi:phage/plasmid-like protein (TIGR03299 family)
MGCILQSRKISFHGVREMAHELTQRKNGFVEMAYVGDAPWHKLGQELTADASIDQWIVQAGMEWKIQRSKVRYAVSREGDSSGFLEMDSQHVLFRSDNKEALGIVSPKFKIVQPRETLEAMRDLIPQGFTLNTAGTLFGGRQFWALASIGASACILGRDEVKGFLLITSACDGSRKTTGKFVAERVVCNNTMSIAMRETGKEVRQSHRTEFDPAAMKAELGIMQDSFGTFIEASRRLALVTINKAEAQQLTGQLLIDSKAVTKADVATSSGYKTILDLFQHGKGNHGETAWDWVNGVTEYVDHVQRAKSDSHRMANSMFGKGDALKTMAFERALAIAE